MEWFHIVTLLLAGLGTGFLIGLVGVGGGIVFAPVLLYYYQAVGFGPDAVAQLAVATSLFCVFLAATTTAWNQVRRRSADLRTAIIVGLASVAGVVLVARFVTTQPWFDARIFQIILGTVIFVSVIRMLLPHRTTTAESSLDPRAIRRVPAFALSSAGVATGGLSAVAGVGGGIILVPVYSEFFKYPIHLSTGTSSATIVVTSLAGVITYIVLGTTPAGSTGWTVGTVDIATGLFLALPAMFSSRLGVATAHHLPRRALVLTFVVIATMVSGKLLFDAVMA